jgi:hypothetical protein
MLEAAIFGKTMWKKPAHVYAMPVNRSNFAFYPRNGAFCPLPLVSVFVSGEAKAGFRGTVSASKISVPGLGGDGFDD